LPLRVWWPHEALLVKLLGVIVALPASPYKRDICRQPLLQAAKNIF
jgi:hypothetical protein